ncbi:ABC transporter permease [Chryseomicrobium imtechense]
MSLGNFFKLVWNEQVKIFGRKSAWVMVGLVVLLVIGSGIMTNSFLDEWDTKEYSNDWRTELTEENAALEAEIEEAGDFGGFTQQMRIDQNNVALAEDIQPKPYDAWAFTYDNTFMMMIVSLFAIVTAAGIVSNEFKWGTIKLLLIRPIQRSKILLAKYVSVFIFTGILLVTLFVSSVLVGAVLFGINDITQTSVIPTMSGEYLVMNYMTAIWQEYGFSMVSLVMMTTLAFMISTLFRSSGMAIGISLFLLLSNGALMLFLSRFDWAKFVLFANTDLGQYVEGGTPLIDGMTLGFSVTMLVIYLVVFLAASFVTFTKRDVA